jgi:PAS domain
MCGQADEIGALLLDRELRITYFTPQIPKILPIHPEDLGCAVNRLGDRLNYPTLPDRRPCDKPTGYPHSSAGACFWCVCSLPERSVR